MNAIVNGDGNTIQPEVSHSIIGNGQANSLLTGASHAGIASGFRNCVSSKIGAILGGQENVVTGGASMIGGGIDNRVDGAFSAILGGTGNVVGAAYNWAGVFGCNVAAVMSCAMHSNRLVIQDVPLLSAGIIALPLGAVYADDITTPGICCLMIK